MDLVHVLKVWVHSGSWSFAMDMNPPADIRESAPPLVRQRLCEKYVQSMSMERHLKIVITAITGR